jgi:hypothetical protein
MGPCIKQVQTIMADGFGPPACSAGNWVQAPSDLSTAAVDKVVGKAATTGAKPRRFSRRAGLHINAALIYL